MKRTLLLILPVILFFGATHAEGLNAINWLHFIGATIYDSHGGFMPEALITREQASKFVSRVAIDQFDYEETNLYPCNFSDIGNADPTLTPFISSVCKLGFMKGRQGEFNPFGNLTQGEAMTIVMRLYTGVVEDPESERYHKYVELCNAISFDLIIYPNLPVSRGIFANWLQKAAFNANTITTSDADGKGFFLNGVWMADHNKDIEVYGSGDCEYYQNVLACSLNMDTCPDHCQ